MAICEACGVSFRAKRSTARYCSPACRKAAFVARENGAESACRDDGTLRRYDDATLSVPCAPERDPAEAVAIHDAIDLGRLAGDTVPDRRWRILVEDGGYTLQCEAMVPGGWMSVRHEPTILALRRFAAWMGLSIGPVVAEQPELVAA